MISTLVAIAVVGWVAGLATVRLIDNAQLLLALRLRACDRCPSCQAHAELERWPPSASCRFGRVRLFGRTRENVLAVELGIRRKP